MLSEPLKSLTGKHIVLEPADLMHHGSGNDFEAYNLPENLATESVKTSHVFFVFTITLYLHDHAETRSPILSRFRGHELRSLELPFQGDELRSPQQSYPQTPLL